MKRILQALAIIIMIPALVLILVGLVTGDSPFGPLTDKGRTRAKLDQLYDKHNELFTVLMAGQRCTDPTRVKELDSMRAVFHKVGDSCDLYYDKLYPGERAARAAEAEVDRQAILRKYNAAKCN